MRTTETARRKAASLSLLPVAAFFSLSQSLDGDGGSQSCQRRSLPFLLILSALPSSRAPLLLSFPFFFFLFSLKLSFLHSFPFFLFASYCCCVYVVRTGKQGRLGLV
ncbi:uncharacterized protein DS421_1g09170 [Arachis hypogaea]|nr:uncharacterized protein DS421_1g09170 [Arachis hypogaea]